MTDIVRTAPRAETPRPTLASFFIARPIFAIVLAIVVSLAGAIGLSTLPVSQYPEIAPTTVTVRANYPGASAEAVENSVTTVLEGAMTGLSDLQYMQSNSSTGSASVTLTFGSAVDPDIAQVQVQNKVALVERRLPPAVQQSGVQISRSGDSMMMVGNIISRDGRYTSDELADIMATIIEPRIEQVDGVGSIQPFGSSYAMRIWLDPLSLAEYSLNPSDVSAAIQQQNSQVSVGTIGASPTVEGQQLRATVTAQSLLQTPEQFENIIIRAGSDGATVRLRDIASVELGLETYGTSSTYNGMPAAGFGVQLASGANAVATGNNVRAELDSLKPALPEGIDIAYSYETTPFVEKSIEKVQYALVEAILLVFVVLFVFLQNFRATLIPMIAVPVVLLGTFGVLAVAGFSVNSLTMFAMVLAIGLLVDDAIVVVENVERLMTTEGLSAREATEKSMREITGALIGIGLVLTAVFIPMAFMSGSVGVIYRQFSITISTAMVLSVLVAVILTPALCATMLKPHDPNAKPRFQLFGWFNRGFANLTERYASGVGYLVRRPMRMMVVFLAVCGGAWHVYQQMPTSFVPAEDQGVLMTMVTLPAGANMARTQAVIDEVERFYLEQESDTVESVFINLGSSFGGSGENQAMGFVKLKDFELRKTQEQSASAVVSRASSHFAKIRDAQIMVLAPPAIQGLGQASGVSMMLIDTAGTGASSLAAAANELAAGISNSAAVSNLRGNTAQLGSQLKVVIDQERAGALGVDLGAANALLSSVFSSVQVNDFLHEGELKPVIMTAAAPYRMQPEDIVNWFVRNASGEMVPFSAFATTQWEQASASLARFNGAPAVALSGSVASGVSSGDAMDDLQSRVSELEGGFSVAWTGLSYEEQLAGSQAMMLYLASILVVFLCLAALYESWSIPFSVILAVPVGIFGAVIASHSFGQADDVYFKVGLLTTVGLAAKNAILIVEFARELAAQGRGTIEAVTEAARLRLRPITMTSVAFILGVLPLAIASGAGSGAQNAIGIGVVGGMISATLLGIFFVPIFFTLVQKRNRKSTAPA